MTIPVETRSKCIRLYNAIYERGDDIFSISPLTLSNILSIDKFGFMPNDGLYQLMLFHFLMFVDNNPSDFEITFIEEMNSYYNTPDRYRVRWRPKHHIPTQHPLGHARHYLTDHSVYSLHSLMAFYDEMSKLASEYGDDGVRNRTIEVTDYMTIALKKDYYIQSFISAFG